MDHLCIRLEKKKCLFRPIIHFLKMGSLSFSFWVVSVLHILATGRISDTRLTVSPSSPGLPMLSVVSFTVKRFSLWWSPTCLFLLLVSDAKNHHRDPHPGASRLGLLRSFTSYSIVWNQGAWWLVNILKGYWRLWGILVCSFLFFVPSLSGYQGNCAFIKWIGSPSSSVFWKKLYGIIIYSPLKAWEKAPVKGLGPGVSFWGIFKLQIESPYYHVSPKIRSTPKISCS